MNRSELAYALLKEKGTVRMGDLPRSGTLNSYTGRNAFAEAKPLAAADGFEIIHAYGDSWEGNSYTLRELPKESDNAVLRVACHKCGHVFEARKRDVKAGQGRFCSRRCSGAVGGKRRVAKLKARAVPDGVQLAIL